MRLYVPATQLAEAPNPLPSEQRLVSFVMGPHELTNLSTFAGMGAAAGLAADNLKSAPGLLCSVQKAVSQAVENTTTEPRASEAILPFHLPEITLLADLIKRGIFADAVQRQVPLSRMYMGKNGDLSLEAQKLHRDLQVAQSVGWLSTAEAAENFDLYHKHPDSPLVKFGPNPPADESPTRPGMRPVTLAAAEMVALSA